MCTINMGVSYLYLRCFVSVCPWFICNGIASAFIYDSFSTIISTTLPCFSGTNIACHINTLFDRLDSCSTLFYISYKLLHNLWILSGLQHPSKQCFHLSISQKNCWKSPHMDLKLQLMALSHPDNIPDEQKLLILYD